MCNLCVLQENADVSSGQILIVGAILRSNLYESCSDEDKTKVLQLLLTAGKERNYLNLASFTFLVDLFKKVSFFLYSRKFIYGNVL